MATRVFPSGGPPSTYRGGPARVPRRRRSVPRFRRLRTAARGVVGALGGEAGRVGRPGLIDDAVHAARPADCEHQRQVPASRLPKGADRQCRAVGGPLQFNLKP